VATLYRAIRKDDDGRPWISHRVAKGLGVRSDHDIYPDEEGLVHPGDGGASVCLSVEGIPWFLREESVWSIEEEALGSYLVYRDDPDREGHGFLEPTYSMELRDYQEAIEETRDDWRECA
jgi:hypothetical protein